MQLAEGLGVRFLLPLFWARKKKQAGFLFLLLAALTAVQLDDLAERFRLEVEIALYC